ncbi:MAG TPA: hypothetical protein VHS96_10895 [Bacteroidia bacterium]|nr:hypothetical protein [Bacteroidia bacterium]
MVGKETQVFAFCWAVFYILMAGEKPASEPLHTNHSRNALAMDICFSWLFGNLFKKRGLFSIPTQSPCGMGMLSTDLKALFHCKRRLIHSPFHSSTPTKIQADTAPFRFLRDCIFGSLPPTSRPIPVFDSSGKTWESSLRKFINFIPDENEVDLVFGFALLCGDARRFLSGPYRQVLGDVRRQGRCIWFETP